MSVLEFIWALIQALMLPGVLLLLVATTEVHNLREVFGFGGLIVLAGMQTYFLIARVEHGHVPSSAYWLKFHAPAFAFMGVLFAVNIIRRRLRKRNP